MNCPTKICSYGRSVASRVFRMLTVELAIQVTSDCRSVCSLGSPEQPSRWSCSTHASESAAGSRATALNLGSSMIKALTWPRNGATQSFSNFGGNRCSENLFLCPCGEDGDRRSKRRPFKDWASQHREYLSGLMMQDVQMGG